MPYLKKIWDFHHEWSFSDVISKVVFWTEMEYYCDPDIDIAKAIAMCYDPNDEPFEETQEHKNDREKTFAQYVALFEQTPQLSICFSDVFGSDLYMSDDAEYLQKLSAYVEQVK